MRYRVEKARENYYRIRYDESAICETSGLKKFKPVTLNKSKYPKGDWDTSSKESIKSCVNLLNRKMDAKIELMETREIQKAFKYRKEYKSYIDHLSVTTKEWKRAEGYLYSMLHFLTECDIDPNEWHVYFGKLKNALLFKNKQIFKVPVSPTTVGRYISVLNRFIKHCHANHPRSFPLVAMAKIEKHERDALDRMCKNLLSDIQLKRRKGQFISKEHIRAIHEVAADGLRQWWVIAFETGGRKREVLGVGIERGHVKKVRMKIKKQAPSVSLDVNKNAELVSVKMKDRDYEGRNVNYSGIFTLDELITSIKEFKRVEPNTITRQLNRACKKLGFNYTPHDVRRTVATIRYGKASETKDLYEAMNQLGHNDLRTASKYLRKAKDNSFDLEETLI